MEKHVPAEAQTLSSMQQLLFFMGAFISAMGTHTFPSSGLAFMSSAGLSLVQIGLVMMMTRIATFTTNFVFGDLISQLSPQKTIVYAELLNVLVTVALIIVWGKVVPLFWIFIILVFFRSAIIAVTSPSQQKIVKSVFSASRQSLKLATILMNCVNYGSVVLAMGIAWYAIEYRSFTFILIFDGATFLFNGLLVLLSLGLGSRAVEWKPLHNPFQKFYSLRNLRSGLLVCDVLLHLTVFGTNILMIRLCGEHKDWIPILLVTFGIAVWISGFLSHHFDSRMVALISWAFIPISFLTMLFGAENLWILLLGVFLRNIIYWNVFNFHSVEIQNLSDKSNISSLTSARMAQNVLILGSGEAVMGAVAPYVPLASELMVRSLLGVGFAIYAIRKTR